MIIAVFGNAILESDSLPLRLLPKLQLRFPNIDFRVLDPNEEWDVGETLTILDSVAGITNVTTFDNLDHFESAPHVSMHDFDAYANLRLLQKLGKLKRITIVGVPQNMDEDAALPETESAIKAITH